MKNAELRHRQTPTQPVPRQSKGATTESPHSQPLAQLQTADKNSLQAGKLNRLAAMADAASTAVAQRKLAGMIDNSPHVAAQRKVVNAIQPDAPAMPNRTGLPDNLKSGIESLSGISMESVRVHYNSTQPAQLNALAYARGNEIHVAPGQEKHLPHEAWHLVQQAQGRVTPTLQAKGGVPVNDDQGLEREADAMGRKAADIGRTNLGDKAKNKGEVAQRPGSQAAQLTKHGQKIEFTFNSPSALIKPVFSKGNTVFGATKFEYDVTFTVDEQGTPGQENYRIGEFRQYYKGGLRVFGAKFDWKDDWVEDTLGGNDHYGYRNANTHASEYIVNEGAGDKLEMWDKPEVNPINKPDEIAYDQWFKGEVVAVDRPGGQVKEVLETREWHLKGVGTRDEKDKTYDVYYSQLNQRREKSSNKSKRKRKEEAGKYDKPTPMPSG